MCLLLGFLIAEESILHLHRLHSGAEKAYFILIRNCVCLGLLSGKGDWKLELHHGNKWMAQLDVSEVLLRVYAIPGGRGRVVCSSEGGSEGHGHGIQPHAEIVSSRHSQNQNGQHAHFHGWGIKDLQNHPGSPVTLHITAILTPPQAQYLLCTVPAVGLY